MGNHRKAAFFDLDGTLAVSNRPPAAADTAAIRALRAAGHLAVLCTGRSRGYLYPEILNICFDAIISGAGARIELDNRLLYRCFLSADELRLIIGRVMRTGRACVLEGEEQMLVVGNGADRDLPWPRIASYDDLDARYHGQAISKCTLFGVLDEDDRRVLDPVFSVIQNTGYAEILPAGCCKSDGLRRVIEAADIRREDSLAFGDSPNDSDMLRYAGIGIAMGNAPDSVKADADYVTGTLEQNGVAMAINRLVLYGGH